MNPEDPMNRNDKAKQEQLPKTLGGLVDAAYSQAYRRYGDAEMAVMIATVVANEAILNGIKERCSKYAA